MVTPPPLDEETWESPRAAVVPHDHAVVVFSDEAGLLAPLRTFVDDGLRRNELIVFVHSFGSDDEAWRFLQRSRGDAPGLREDQAVVVSLYKEALQGSGPRIDYEHVGKVVEDLGQAAASRGRDATRIFVDASRRYFAEARVEEWFAFEGWLGRRLQAKVGLVCAYQKDDAMRRDILPRMLKTHAYRFEAPV